MLFNRKVIER